MKEIIKEVSGLIILFLLCAVGLFFAFHTLVYENVRPPVGESRDLLMAAFDRAFFVVMVTSAFAVTLWYLVARLARVVHWSDAGKRTTWTVILLVLVLLAIVFATLLFGRPLEGSWLAYVLLVLPALIAYCLPTVFFSPASFKYSPIGASSLRRW